MSFEKEKQMSENNKLREATANAVTEAKQAAEKKNRQLHTKLECLQEQLNLTESQLVDLKDMQNETALQVSGEGRWGSLVCADNINIVYIKRYNNYVVFHHLMYLVFIVEPSKRKGDEQEEQAEI